MIDLWKKQLSPLLETVWASIDFWRIFGISVVTIIVLLVLFKNKISKIIKNPLKTEHDKDIFKKADAILPERKMINTFDFLQADHSFSCGDVIPFDDTILFYEEQQHRYFNKLLNDVTNDYLTSIKNLTNFMSSKFFVYPRGQTGGNLRMCMHPNFNIDREGSGDPSEMEKYDKLTEELDKRVLDARNKYTAYRSLIKKHLLI